MTKLLPLILAGLLATPVHAFDVLNQDDTWGARKEKTAKAPRLQNFDCTIAPWCKGSLRAMGIGTGLGFLGPIGLVALPFTVPAQAKYEAGIVDDFYRGSILRGRIGKDFKKLKGLVKMEWGMSVESVYDHIKAFRVDVGGAVDTDRIAWAKLSDGYEEGDIVDIKIAAGTPKVADLNRLESRIVALYCKHDNKKCQDDYDSALGVMSRHTDTEFPPSQYLIDPAIIAADQAKMRQEEADKKAAQNSGGFNFM